MASVGSGAAAPGIRLSQMSMGGLGNVGNSVNLFRGDVNFPMQLVSVQGRNNLGVAVTAFYSSNVHQQVTTWNKTAPTGVLGAGWSLPFEQIVVEGQNTGSNIDDEFYLVTGGAPRRLVRTGADGDALRFELLDYQFWCIRYFPNAATPAAERWEIVREDGATYTYGLNGIQWGVRWRNWIGSTTVANGQPFPVAWNLVQVQSPQGDSITFEYDNQQVPIGPYPDVTYTRAARLSRIRDVYGQTVEFVYAPKQDFEVQLPHVPPPPDGRNAFQFQYEDHYLDRILMQNEQGQLVLTTRLGYEFHNVAPYPQNKDDHFRKRYLVSIHQEDRTGSGLPAILFDYHVAAESVHPGSLKSVTYPQGAVATYTYAAHPLLNSAARQTVQSPGPGYAPRVWYGARYVVVTWHSAAESRLVTQIYAWGGTWNGWTDTRTWYIADGTLRVVTSDGFYAIYFKDARTGSYRVYLFREHPYRFGEWDRTPYQVTLDADMADPAVAVGRNFAAVADAAAGQLNIVAWNQELNQWTERAFSTARANQVAVTAGPNCCIGAYYTRGSQSLQCAMYYANAEGRWTYSDSYTETVPIDWEVTTPESLLSMGSSFVAVTFIKAVDTAAEKATYGVRILPWSESFQFGQVSKGDYQQGLTINNPIAYSVVQQSVVGNGQHLFRFDGARWQPFAAADPVAGKTYAYAYGSDVAVSAEQDSTGSVSYALFDFSPYDNAWHGPKPAGDPVAAGDGLAAPTVSGDYRTTGRTVYYRTPTLAWEPIHTLPQWANLETVQNRAPAYLAYQDAGNAGTYVLLIQNGSVSPAQELAGERIAVDQAGPGEILAGPNAFVTYRADSFDQAAALYLYRVVNASISQYQTDRSVVQLEISDGYGVQETRFEYDYDTATYDPFGLVTQFVRALVRTGDAAGWTEHIFFNGLNPSVNGVVYPPSDEFTNVRNYFSKVSGQLFRSTAFAADQRKVRTSTNYLYTYTAENSAYRCTGALVRQRKTLDGVAACLFDGPAAAAVGLDQRKVPADLRSLFAARGFPLSDPVTVTVEVAGRLWTIADGAGQEYQALLDGGALQLYGWRYDAAEAEYNARGQVARTIAHNVDSDGEPETLVTETTYAWEVYPELAQLNYLTPVAQTRTINASRNVVTGSNATTYTRDWDGGAGGPWAPHRMYAWAGGQAQAVFAHAAVAGGADPGPDWVRTAEVLAVTPRALPVVTADLDGNLGGSLFDTEQQFAVAVAAGANPLAGEVTYFGFEAYEDAGIWSITPAGADPADYINAGDAFTGARRLIIPGDPARRIGLSGTLAPANGNQPFLLSCWIKTEPGFVADPAVSAWEIRVTGSAGPAPPLLVPIPATGGRWQYFHTIIDPAVLQVGPMVRLALEVYSRQDHKYLLVDDVFCAPLYGQCRAAVYDPFDKSLLAKVDSLGNVRRLAYDHLRRPVAEIGDSDVPRSLWVDYLWRQHHDGAFDPADPSASLMATPRGGTYTDFRHGDEWQEAWSASPGWTAGEGELRFAGGARGTLAFRDAAITANCGIRFMLTYGEPVDQPIGFSLGSAFTAQWQKGAWELLDGQGNRLATTPQPVLDSQDLLLLAGRHGVVLLANGRRVLQYVFPDAVSGPVTFFTANRLAVNWTAVFADPVVGASFVDNAGRQRQLQELDDARARVSAKLYDGAGRAAGATRSVVFDATLFGYRTGFTAPISDVDGAMGPCELTAAYPEDQGYPFSRTRFEASPLARPVEQGAPGRDLAINPAVPEAERHTIRTTYGLNVRNGTFDDLPSGQYEQTTVRNPDGVAAATIADRLGRPVAGRQGPVETGDGALTRLFYDAYGNVTRALQPNAFDPDVSDRDRFAAQMSYDFFGNVLQSQVPDATAPAQSVYDRAARLRFFQSADGATRGYVNYLRYDAIGRVAEEGTCNCAWDRTALHAHADERDWLPAAGLWSRRYVYDGTGQDLRLLGRLWKAQTGRGDGSSAVLAEITLAYDAAGQLASRTTSVSAYDGGVPHQITFGYDFAGNMTRVTYDAERGEAAFSIIYARNGLNEVVGVAARDGAAGLPQPVAAYSYRPDGGVSVETYNPGRSGELRRTYTYSPAGWLAAVQDPYLSETLAYTAGGYHDAGYYTGQVARAAELFSGVDQPGFVSSYEYAYAYDPLGRLVVAQNSAGSNWSLGVNRPISHDANGNTVDLQAGADQEQFTYYPGTNRLQNTDGSAARAYEYDESGNLTADRPAGLAGITYDRVSGLVTRVNRTAGGAVTPLDLAYDAAGNRVLKTWESMRRLYVPNADGVPLLLKTAEGGAETTDFLIYGPAGLIGVRRGGRTYHILRGRLGSTRGIYDGVGLIAAYNYMPYGGFMGPVFEKAGAPSMPYLFTGQEYDREVGLYNFKARLYDPATGRFIRTDPAGQYPSPYLYAGNDPVNFYDPTGAFSWSWAAFGAVVGGVLLIAGGIALTIATAGAATPLLVAGVIGGGLLIGAGVGSAAYGFSHADASKSNFDPVEWGIMVGLGAGFGALGAGLGFAAAGLGALGALAVETAIGTGLGSLDGFITNGAINSYHNQDFTANWQSAVGFGAAAGFAGGAIGGALGRGPMLRTNRLVQQSRGLGPDATGTLYVATQNTTRTIWHSVVGTRLPLKAARFTELVAEFDHISVGAILRGGQETDIIESGGLRAVRDWTAHRGTMRTVGMSSVDLPIPNVQNARTFARDALGPHGEFNFLTNGCTSWAREVLRASGIEPPLWTLSATGLEFWVRTLGRRVV